MSFIPVFVGRAEEGGECIRVYKLNQSFEDLYLRVEDGNLERIPVGVEIITWSDSDYFFVEIAPKPLSPQVAWMGKAKGTRYDLIAEDAISDPNHPDVKERAPLFCECNDFDCFRGLPIDDAEYTALHKRYPDSAIVMAGHEGEDEAVLLRAETYTVVKPVK